MIVDLSEASCVNDECKVIGELSPNCKRKVESSPNEADPDYFANEMRSVNLLLRT